MITTWQLHPAPPVHTIVAESTQNNPEQQPFPLVYGVPIPPHKVQLMPQGTDLGTIRGRDESLIEVCKTRGYRYCNRLHIELFGNTRGT